MIRRTPPPLLPETRELLESERDVPPLPAVVRARALARARAALTAGVAAQQASATPAPRFRWAAAAALALLASGAVAAAYEIRARVLPATEAPAAPPVGVAARPTPASPTTELVSPEPAAPIAAGDSGTAHAAAEPRLSRADVIRAELRLLRQARAAVAREDFVAALGPIAEHARRFKDGRLVEEREALRVKTLAGLGRTDEARRAAAAFEARFPHSVLLPAVSQMSAAGR